MKKNANKTKYQYIKISKFILISVFAVLCLFALPKFAKAAVEFVSVIDPGNGMGTDYTSLSAWENAVQSNLATTTTKVFSYATTTDNMADNIFVIGETSGATGTLVHRTASSTHGTFYGTAQVLIKSITGTFQANEKVKNVNNTAQYVYITDTGSSTIAVAKCRTTTGAPDTTAVEINGWTTATSTYIKVWTDPNEYYRHQGKWDERMYQLVPNTSLSPMIIYEPYTTVDGLQISSSYSSAWSQIFYIAEDGNGYRLRNCILKGSSLAVDGIYTPSSITSLEIFISNNIIYGVTSRAIYENYVGSGSNIYISNNTIINSNFGIVRTEANVLIKNNISYNNTDNYNGTFHASSANNLSGPTQSDAPGSNQQNAKVVHFVDEYNYDFRLDSADTAARNKGANLYADSNLPVTTDIEGQTRPNSATTFDIGADEAIARIYRSVGPSATTALATGGASNYGNLEIKPAYLGTSTTRVVDYIATFWRPLPDNVGVGDAIQYDDDGDEDIDANDSIAFITRRLDSSHYSVRTATGSAPTATIEPDADWSVYRSYTSLAKAESNSSNADENDSLDDDLENFDNWSSGRDIVSNQEQWNVACYAGPIVAGSSTPDTTAVTIDGWTTGTSTYLQIYTPTRSDEVGTSQRHAGKWDDAKYRIRYAYTANSQSALLVNDDFVKIIGLQLKGISTNYDWDKIISFSTGINNGAYIDISNNIIKGEISGTADNNFGIASDWYGSGVRSLYVWNNIIYDVINGAVRNVASYFDEGWKVYFYNNTIINSYDGIENYANSILKNNIFKGSSDTYLGTFATGTDNNATDGTDSIGTGANNRTSQTFKFLDEANDDFHLAPGDTGARNYGADLTNDPVWRAMMFGGGDGGYWGTDLGGTDIDGTDLTLSLSFARRGDEITRPRGTMWDIGADELITKIYRSVGPGQTSALAVGTAANGLTISATGTATFKTALPDNVGVGDVIQYNSSTSVAFIKQRISNIQYLISTATGTYPVTLASSSSWAIHRAYTSLYNAERGNENDALDNGVEDFDNWDGTGDYTDTDEVGRNISTNSEQWNIACYAGPYASGSSTPDTTAVTIDGWTTAPQNYIRVYTPVSTTEVGASQRHQGKWDDNKYRIKANNSWPLSLTTEFITLDGLQLTEINPGASGHRLLDVSSIDSANKIMLSNNIFKGHGSKTYFQYAIGTADTDAKMYYWNNLMYGIDTAQNNYGIMWQGDMYIYNSTFIGTNVAIRNQGTGKAIIKNTITQSAGDGFMGSFDPASDYNISDLAADAPGANSRNGVTVAFLDAANNDFHLSPSDTAARGWGRNLSQDQNLPIRADIDNQSRAISNIQYPISNWDIGADQSATPIYRSVAPSLTTALDTGSADSNNLTITLPSIPSSRAIMTVGTATPDNVGVGDAVQYDSDGNSTIDAIAFISGRASSSRYYVQSRDGGWPPTVTNDRDWSIFRAYTSLSNAEAGTENTGINDIVEEFDRDVSVGGGKDIYTANQQWNIAAYANGTTADTAAMNIQSWTTYHADYIRVFTPYLSTEVGTSQRHQGKWDSSKYALSSSDYYGTIRINENNAYNLEIDGLQIENTRYINTSGPEGHGIKLGSYWSPVLGTNPGINVKIKNNIIRKLNPNSGFGDSGIFAFREGTQLKIHNNILYDFNYGLSFRGYGNSVYQIYNNTIYNGLNISIYLTNYWTYGNRFILKNNLTQSQSSNYAITADADTVLITANNLSKDATSPNAAFRNQTVRFADAANKDFHLASNDTAARNQGADLTYENNIQYPISNIQYDIDGHLRSTTTHSGNWDIGADEGRRPFTTPWARTPPATRPGRAR